MQISIGQIKNRIMGSHPVNLTFRFILEIAALIAVGTWAWKQSDGSTKYILAVGLPILIGAIWGTFTVPDDPSRSGETIVVTSGMIRLVIELGIFTLATLALYDQGQQKFSYCFAIAVIIHYAVSYDRIFWLLEH